MKRPEGRIYFDTFQQKKEVEKAAKARKWSLSRFMIEASLAMAKQTFTTVKQDDPLLTESKMPALNQ